MAEAPKNPELETDNVEHMGTLQTLTNILEEEVNDSLGYDIQLVNPEGKPQQPVPVGDALPFSFSGGVVTDKVEPLFADDLTKRLVKNPGLLVEIPDNRANNTNLRPIDLSITKSAYAAAVAAGLDPNLFDGTGKFVGSDLFDRAGEPSPTATTLASLVTPTDRQKAIAAVTAEAGSKLGMFYHDDLGNVQDLTGPERDELLNVTQAFDFHDGADEDSPRIRLLNFSDTPLTPEHIKDVTDVIWWYANATLGGIYEELQTIAIMPEGNPSMWVEQMINGELKKVPRNGWQGPNVLALSQRGFQRPEDRTERPPEIEEFFNQLLEAGEALGDARLRHSVSEGEPAKTLAHEFWHRVMPSLLVARGITDYSAYARTSEEEKEAETGAAVYVGGAAFDSLSPSEYMYAQGRWRNYRAKRITDGAQPGPRALVCREIDLSKGPLPPSFDRATKQVTTKISYHLESDLAATSAS